MIKGVIAETKYNGKSENGKMIRIEVDGEKKFYFTGECGEQVKKVNIGNSVLFECEDKNGTGMLTSIKLDDGKAVAEKPKVEKKEVKATKKEETTKAPKAEEKEEKTQSIQVGAMNDSQRMLLGLTVQALSVFQGMVEPKDAEEIIEKIYNKLASLVK